MELQLESVGTESKSVEATFEEIFAHAMRNQPQIQHIVVASEQGLVIAFKSKTKGQEQHLAALSPVLGDAGEAVFNALSLTPLGEIMLIGSEGTAYFARLKSAPAFLVVGAKGVVNVGLLRIVAAEIETRAGGILLQVLT
jgi:predicted regulator of Ras-like GTPase activity (Roadblock/LC7/MglB family)